MKEAKFYETKTQERVQCHLCPHNCLISDGKSGICRIRKNIDGKLYLSTYGSVSSIGFDPIEKKPLYHFYPGNFIFSIGNFGCNLKCKFCQNWQISQQEPEGFETNRIHDVEELVHLADHRRKNIGIAYTYNEPTVWFEFMEDIAVRAKKRGLKNVMVTNGFINPKPLDELVDVMDAFNVDLKAFNEDFYKTQTFSKLEPVKDTLKTIRKSGKHLEITNLVITGLNDDYREFSEMIRWIAGELGRNTVVHLSRYYPSYKSAYPSTDPDMLEELYGIAREELDFVYLGNINSREGQHTYCPSCGAKVISRSRYQISINGLDGEGKCLGCAQQVVEDFKFDHPEFNHMPEV